MKAKSKAKRVKKSMTMLAMRRRAAKAEREQAAKKIAKKKIKKMKATYSAAPKPPYGIESDEIWVQRDGTKIEVQGMSEQHAKNVLRMILRQRRQKLLALYEANHRKYAEAMGGTVADDIGYEAKDFR